MRVENAFLRAAIGSAIFVGLLTVFLFFMSPAMALNDPSAKTIYLVFAGPAGAMVTHLHEPLLALLVLLFSPFVITASVSRRWRKPSLALAIGFWLALGAMFATIPLSG